MSKFLLNHNRHFYLFFSLGLLLLTVSHFPFLHADADYELSWSRGAWTDEGLHTCQIRNLMQHNDTSLDKSDNLIKTPLLGALFLGTYHLFGISLESSRLAVLGVAYFFLLLSAYGSFYITRWYLWSIPIFFLEYYIFHYSHLALSEILSGISILAGIAFLYRSVKEYKLRFAFYSAVFFSMAYYFKIQYLYIIALPFLFGLFYFVLYKIKHKVWHVPVVKTTVVQFSTLAALGILYYLLWYAPNQELYDYIMKDQTNDRFANWDELWPTLNFYYHDIFLSPSLRWYTFSFFLSLATGVLLLFHRQTSADFRLLFILTVIWLLLEMHKLPMKYLPSRYLVSSYIAMGSLISLVFSECLASFFKRPYHQWLGIPLVIANAWLFGSNVKHYFKTLEDRRYSIFEVSEAIGSIALEGRPIVGPWAPALSWKTQGYTFPVWYNYFNDKDLLEKFHPKVIISEMQEEDSGQAFKNQGIVLDCLATEIRYYKVAHWDIKMLLLK